VSRRLVESVGGGEMHTASVVPLFPNRIPGIELTESLEPLRLMISAAERELREAGVNLPAGLESCPPSLVRSALRAAADPDRAVSAATRLIALQFELYRQLHGDRPAAMDVDTERPEKNLGRIASMIAGSTVTASGRCRPVAKGKKARGILGELLNGQGTVTGARRAVRLLKRLYKREYDVVRVISEFTRANPGLPAPVARELRRASGGGTAKAR